MNAISKLSAARTAAPAQGAAIPWSWLKNEDSFSMTHQSSTNQSRCSKKIQSSRSARILKADARFYHSHHNLYEREARRYSPSPSYHQAKAMKCSLLFKYSAVMLLVHLLPGEAIHGARRPANGNPATADENEMADTLPIVDQPHQVSRILKGDKKDDSCSRIDCTMLPMNITEDFDMDRSLICPAYEGTFFRVYNDPVIDCKGFRINGRYDKSTVFEVHGGATFRNCIMENHKDGIYRDDTGVGDKLIIENCKFHAMDDGGIEAYYDDNNGSADMDILDVIVRDSEFIAVDFPIYLEILGSHEVEKSSLAWGFDPKTKADAITLSYVDGTENYQLTVKESFITGFAGDCIRLESPEAILTVEKTSITASDERGIYIKEPPKKVKIKDTQILGMIKQNLYLVFSPEPYTESIELEDVVLCESRQGSDIYVSNATTLDLLTITGFVICDDVFDNDVEKNYTDSSLYCTASCDTYLGPKLCN